MRATVGAGTAAGVLLLGVPVLVDGQDPAVDTAAPVEEVSLALASARSHRWPGHPGRAVRIYRVRPGDTVTGLAVRFHAWTAELRTINHLGRHAGLVAGERIRIPVVVAATRKHTGRKHTGRKHTGRKHTGRKHTGRKHTGRKHHGAGPRAHRHPKPWRHADAGRATVRRTIVRTARHYGVDPHVALALAWQESGWQQRRTSSAGAVGTMQVLPSTGKWMSLYVGRRLNVYGLRDNIVTGVVLFKVLRTQTTWRRSIAAYYQGLGAVRRHGPYSSTRRYTRNVIALYHRLERGWNPA